MKKDICPDTMTVELYKSQIVPEVEHRNGDKMYTVKKKRQPKFSRSSTGFDIFLKDAATPQHSS